MAAILALLKREGIPLPSGDFVGLLKGTSPPLYAAALGVAHFEAQRSLAFQFRVCTTDPRSQLLLEHGRDVLQSLGASLLLATLLLDQPLEFSQEEFALCLNLGEDLDSQSDKLLAPVHATVASVRKAVHLAWHEGKEANLSAQLRLRDDRLDNLTASLTANRERSLQAKAQAARASSYLQAVRMVLLLIRIVDASTRAVRQRYGDFAAQALETYKHPLLSSATAALVPGGGPAGASPPCTVSQALVCEHLTTWQAQWLSQGREDLLPSSWLEEIKSTWATALAALQQSMGADALPAAEMEELLQRCSAAISKTLARLVAPFAGPQSVCEMLWSFPLEQVATFVQQVLLPCEQRVEQLQRDCNNKAAVAETIVHTIERAERGKQKMDVIKEQFHSTAMAAMAIKKDHDLCALKAKHADASERAELQNQLERQLENVQHAIHANDDALKELLALAEFYPECLLVIPQEKLKTQLMTSASHFLQFASLERSIGAYRNVCRLPSESNHVLFRAKYSTKECVLKHFDLTKDSKALLREADILRRLDHPNIIKLQCLFLHQGNDGIHGYLELPLYRIGDLGKWLDRVKDDHIDSQRVHDVAVGMHAGLRYLEQQGVLHLDIKPGNVLLDLQTNSDAFRVALCDFDVGLETRVRTTRLIGEQVGLHGTVGYVAPERLKDPTAVATHKADMFSFGVVLHNMYFHPRELPEAREPFGEELFGAVGEVSHENWAQDAPRCLRGDLLCFEPAARKSASELNLIPGRHGLQVDVSLPPHWNNRDPLELREALVDVTADDQIQQMGQLLNSCRGTSTIEFKIESVHRVENAMLWSSYVHRRTQLYRARSRGRILQQAHVRTAHASWLQTCTDADIMKHTNEVFLFHGTTKAKAIASNGFLRSKYRFSCAAPQTPLFGDRFGNGLYFAEDSDKSHCYTDGKERTIIVARVLLGAFQTFVGDMASASLEPGTLDPAIPLTDETSPLDRYDSIVAMPPKEPREFIVHQSDQVFPEYIVTYKAVEIAAPKTAGK